MRAQTTSNMQRHFISVTTFCLITLMMPTTVFAQEGTLKSGKITSPVLENLIGDSTTKPYRIYLPPSYETSDERYPTVYILPGYSQTIGSFIGAFPIKSTADSMIRNGDIKEMIVVFVEGYNKFGGAYFLNSETIGDYETYVIRDLVNHIDANYRTIAHRNSRGITGYSMGGDSAMHLAMKFPETFSVVVPNAAGYDRISDWWSGFARQTAFVNPKN